MRTIRIAVIALCAGLTACNLYWHDTARGDPPDHGSGAPDAGFPDGNDPLPDAWVIDDAPPDSGSGSDCHGSGDGGGLPDAAVDDAGCGSGGVCPDAHY
jgi:hypothetical protein